MASSFAVPCARRRAHTGAVASSPRSSCRVCVMCDDFNSCLFFSYLVLGGGEVSKEASESGWEPSTQTLELQTEPDTLREFWTEPSKVHAKAITYHLSKLVPLQDSVCK